MKKFLIATLASLSLFCFTACQNQVDSSSSDSGNKSKTVSVTDIEITSIISEIAEGKSFNLTANVLPENATNKNLIYSSSDTTLATVSSKGLVKAKKECNSVIIKVTSDENQNIYAELNLRILPKIAVTGLQISLENIPSELEEEDTIQLTAVIQPSNASYTSVSWTSSDEDSATVDKNGLVTAKKVTDAVTITATSTDNSSVSDSITFKILPQSYSKGLKFELLPSGDAYKLVGLGTCTSKKIKVPPTYNNKPVEVIGKESLSYSKLEQIILPDSIKTIEDEAFSTSTNIKELIIPDSVETIGSNLFYLYSNNPWSTLERLYIGKNVKTIGKNAFSSSYIKYFYFNAINIENYGEKPFSYFGKNVEEGYELVIGKDVKVVPDNFLVSGYYPGDYGANSSNVKSIIFEDGCTCERLGKNAFANISTIDTFTLPETIKEIGYDALNFTKINTLYFNAENLEKCDLEFSSLGRSMVADENNITGYKIVFGKNVKEIKASWFKPYSSSYKSYIKSISFEEGSLCEKIEANSFSYNNNLTEFEFPENLKTVGKNILCDCDNIKKIYFNSKNVQFDTEDYWASGVFDFPLDNPITVFIGKNVEVIPEYFLNVTTIDKIIFEDNSKCTKISKYGFCSANGTGEIINCPWDNIVYVGEHAFNGMKTNCDTLSNVYYVGESGFSSDKSIKKLILNSSNDITIENFAFQYCENLEEIEIGKNVKSIGKQAFYNTISLKKLIYNTESKFNFTENNKRNFIFDKCGTKEGSEGLEVIIGNNVTEIPDNLFFAEAMNEYPYSNGIKNNITKLTFEENSKCCKIGKYAFALTSIQNLSLPESVTSIEDYAFNSCPMQSLTLPESITKIGEGAFLGCFTLKEINFNCKNLSEFDFDDYSIFLWAGKENAKDEELIITIGKAVTQIPGGTFRGVSGTGDEPVPVRLVFEEGSVCKTIGDYAFSQITNLSGDLIIPDSVETIGESAFSSCYNYESLTIGKNVKSIGNNAFRNSNKEGHILKAINFNATACDDFTEDINPFLFRNDTGDSLTITIGKNVTKIPAYMFKKSNINTCKVVFEEDCVCETLGNYSFYNVTMDYFIIPVCLKTIYENNFIVMRSNGYNKYYLGSEEDWNSVNLLKANGSPADPLKNLYFYSEQSAENCWHYVDGKPVEY